MLISIHAEFGQQTTYRWFRSIFLDELARHSRLPISLVPYSIHNGARSFVQLLDEQTLNHLRPVLDLQMQTECFGYHSVDESGT
jgi:hypothetical protein